MPERLHGRAFSADFFFSFASLPLGQLFGAVLLRFADARTIMLWAGVLVLVTTAAAMLSPDARRFSSVPLPGPQDAPPNRRRPRRFRKGCGMRPYAGSYTRDDEGTAARTVTLLREGYWTGLPPA